MVNKTEEQLHKEKLDKKYPYTVAIGFGAGVGIIGGLLGKMIAIFLGVGIIDSFYLISIFSGALVALSFNYYLRNKI